jgi:PTH1 family peptidyl-tRNA hydrolase
MSDSSSERDIYLIAGFGNPGREYRNTRHNVGFKLIDALLQEYRARLSKMQFKAMTGMLDRNNVRIILAKPQTFMNLSGQSVASLVRFYKIPLDKVLVVHDDIDLPLGSIRIRPGGGSGGQKGLASTIEKLGTQDFPRMRIGIGRPSGTQEAAGYVLQEFSKSDEKILAGVLESAVNAVGLFIEEGLEKTMTRYNGNVVKE